MTDTGHGINTMYLWHKTQCLRPYDYTFNDRDQLEQQ